MTLTILGTKVKENKPYRLKCRFKVDPYESPSSLQSKTVTAMEMFVRDMHKQGWEYVTGSEPRLRGPFKPVVPVTIRIPRQLTAKQMLPGVVSGNRFLDQGENVASLVKPLREYNFWEYELALVFYRPEIQMEYPDAHEEEKR